MSKGKVYIENADGHYRKMWERWGWEVVYDYKRADVIQFTGGYDVTPSLYGEASHPQTSSSLRRDENCIGLYDYAVDNGIKMAGICRGGQFLNVLNGGKMFQHCDGHGVRGTHEATILESGLKVQVTSTHHQIMRPNYDAGIVLMISEPLGTFKEHMKVKGGETGTYWAISNGSYEDDVEAIFYPETMSLCYQPHPEWCEEDSDCVKAYKHFLVNYLEIDV